MMIPWLKSTCVLAGSIALLFLVFLGLSYLMESGRQNWIFIVMIIAFLSVVLIAIRHIVFEDPAGTYDR